MTPRLTSAMLVSALIRKVETEGGTGAVLAKGDATAGALLLLIADRGQTVAIRERGLRPDGSSGWISAGPANLGDSETLSTYLERRRKFDSDLWLVELDGMPVDSVDAMLAEM
jgi:hypothetical protein